MTTTRRTFTKALLSLPFVSWMWPKRAEAVALSQSKLTDIEIGEPYTWEITAEEIKFDACMLMTPVCDGQNHLRCTDCMFSNVFNVDIDDRLKLESEGSGRIPKRREWLPDEEFFGMKSVDGQWLGPLVKTR